MRTALILTTCILTVCRPGRAQTRPTLQDVVQAALRQNPDILGARLRTDSAVAGQRIARALPNPTVSTLTGVPFQYSATQLVDVGPQRLYRTRAAAQGTAASRYDLVDVTRQTLFAVRQAFYDVLLSEALRGLAVERRDIFRQLLAADSARLRSGDVPERNVTTSEVQLARAEADLTRADASVHAARLALQLLMGVPAPDTGFTVSGELAYRPVAIPADSLDALAMANRPDIRAADVRVAQARTLSSYATAELFPTPEISLAYQPAAPYTTGSHYAFGVGLSVPLFYWYGGERAQGRAGLEAARVASQRVRAQVGNDVATALDGLRASGGLAERYESGLLAKSQAALETGRYAYRAGANSLLDLLNAIQTYSDTKAEYYTAVHDYWVGVFALGRAVGRDFTP